ncbi:MAG: glycosyltransferase [Ornithinimicrobium sp.]
MAAAARAKPLRVVVATRIFTPDRAAAAFRLQALVSALADRGSWVEVLTARAAPDSADESVLVSDDLRIRRWPVLRDSSGYVRGYLPYASFDVPLALRLLLARRPELVVVEPPPTTGAVVRAVTTVISAMPGRPTPYVYYAADVWSDASESTGAPEAVVQIVRRLEQFALKGAAEVIAVSDGVAERVRELGARSVHVVPNGIDTDIFCVDDPTPHEARSAGEGLGIPEGPFLLYAGTASEWQGAEIFARAMRAVIEQVPSARLVFLGQGSSWPALQQIADELPTGVIELRPLVGPPEAAAWHRAAAGAVVSVKPGLGYDFAYPTKVLAALACGTPVVYAGPGPAAADITDNNLGAAVTYDVESVASAMAAALVADVDLPGRHRRAQWVHDHRSIEATGRAAAAVVLSVMGR